jgi:hypothetical protein
MKLVRRLPSQITMDDLIEAPIPQNRLKLLAPQTQDTPHLNRCIIDQAAPERISRLVAQFHQVTR